MRASAVLTLLGLVLTAGSAAAEEHWYDRIEVGGFVDVYYAYNTNKPRSQDNFTESAGSTAKKSNQFSLNMAVLEITTVDPVIVHLALGFGTGIEVIAKDEPSGDFIGPSVWKYVQEAYVGYRIPLGRGITVEAGILPSHVGLESLQSRQDWNYTRSWLAESSPYYQAGVRVTYPFTDRLSVQLHYLNGWAIVGEDNNWKTFGSQVLYRSDRLSCAFNTLIGPEQPNEHSTWRFLFDGWLSWNATRRWQLALNADYAFEQLPAAAPAEWYGSAVYTRVAVWRTLAVAGRLEVFHDGLGAPADVPRVLTGVEQTLLEATLTVEARLAPEHLILKVEGRYDQSDHDVFETHELSMLTQEPVAGRRQGLIVLGAAATF